MAKALDITKLTACHGRTVLIRRRAKALEYERRKEVLKARNRAWQLANPEKAKACTKAWAEVNREHLTEKKREWYDANRDLQLQRAADAQRNLADSVVRARFAAGSGLSASAVPDELVPVVRLSILIKRELKAKR